MPRLGKFIVVPDCILHMQCMHRNWPPGGTYAECALCLGLMQRSLRSGQDLASETVKLKESRAGLQNLVVI